MRKTAIMTLAAMAAANVWAIKGTLSTEQENLTGDIKWQARARVYSISIMKDKTPIEMERKYDDVINLDIPKPAGYDKAVSQVEGGQGAQAIATLQKIVTDYRMLKWDQPAGRYLVQAYLAAGDAKKAYDVCTSIVNEERTAAYRGDLAPAYWQTLAKMGKMDKLEELLKKAASSGDRASSAAALVMRGDLIVADSNDAPSKLRQALTDGYLRVVLMYRDAECAREHAEACQKAAACFDKLGQPGRAEKLNAMAKEI